MTKLDWERPKYSWERKPENTHEEDMSPNLKQKPLVSQQISNRKTSASPTRVPVNPNFEPKRRRGGLSQSKKKLKRTLRLTRELNRPKQLARSYSVSRKRGDEIEEAFLVLFNQSLKVRCLDEGYFSVRVDAPEVAAEIVKYLETQKSIFRIWEKEIHTIIITFKWGE